MTDYLLDTDVLSQLLKTHPHPKAIAKISTVPASRQFTSSINLAEIYYGAYKVPESHSRLEKIRTIILPHLQVIPFDAQVVERCGRLRAELEKAGRPLALGDLMIASTALAYQMVLATGNIRHFAHVPGLRVEDWFS